ncbi:MAG: hypothetical protein ACI89S_002202, partial [Gammaproteobacteria bacterium]
NTSFNNTSFNILYFRTFCRIIGLVNGLNNTAVRLKLGDSIKRPSSLACGKIEVLLIVLIMITVGIIHWASKTRFILAE